MKESEEPKESEDAPSKKPPKIHKDGKFFLGLISHIKKNNAPQCPLPPKIPEKHNDKGENQVSENANVTELYTRRLDRSISYPYSNDYVPHNSGLCSTAPRKYSDGDSCTNAQTYIANNRSQTNLQPLQRSNSIKCTGSKLGVNTQNPNFEDKFTRSSEVYPGSTQKVTGSSSELQNNSVRYGRNSINRFVKNTSSERDFDETNKISSDYNSNNLYTRTSKDCASTHSALNRNHAKSNLCTKFNEKSGHRDSYRDRNYTKDKTGYRWNEKFENNTSFPDRNYGKEKHFNRYGKNNFECEYLSDKNYPKDKMLTAEEYKPKNDFSGGKHQNDKRLNNCRSPISSNPNSNEYTKPSNTYSSSNFSSVSKHSRSDFENCNLAKDNKTDDFKQRFNNIHGTAIDVEQTEWEDHCEFTEICHIRQISHDSDLEMNLKVTFQTSIEQPGSSEIAKSPTLHIEPSKSQELNQSPGFKFEQSNVFFSGMAVNDMFAENILLPLGEEADIAIPPPVPVKNDSSGNNHNGCETLSGASHNIHSLNEDSNDSETCSLWEPDLKQLEEITAFINNIVKEKSVSCSLADQVARDLNQLFKNHLQGNYIDVYGSYYSNLAISTSDINLVMQADTIVRRGFMHEVYKVLSKEQDEYNVHPYEEGDAASRTQIHFSEPEHGISCQLAYLGKYAKSYKEMGNCLKSICTHDGRVRTLIIAVKIWADMCLINEVEEGKLHPIGFIMMVIHFLQQYEKPILPVPINFYENLKIESPPPPTDSSVGELWIAFLKYYITTFNWAQNVVTITSKDPVSKKSKGWETVWMAIEDPYTGKNIARSVTNSDTADSIKSCFRASYEYFCSNPEDTEASDSTEEDSQNNEDTPSRRPLYSFQQCIVDTSINFCETCDELDDVCEDCQKKIYVAPMASVPAMTEDFLRQIRKVLYSIYDKYMLTDNEVDERREFVKQLQKDFRRIYQDVELHLFGSSANGFGFKNSDLDICMTFKNNKIMNTTSVIKSVRSCLRRNKDFDHLIAILNAQIPILKFYYKPKGWRGDICVDNSLAVHNSGLLYAYSLIDERCKILGCALKLLAKKALIAEVTEKALSSYSYLIMVIHFLQQTEIPVLPVLQDSKLHKKDYKLEDIVEGCNVWYYKGTDFESSKNDTSVEQLWLDMLDYYCSYDPNHVITIRQKEPLSLNEKQFSATSFNIQDPFIEAKNLGRVVSSKKAQETENIFRRARRLFRTPKEELPSNVKDMEEYFFSTMSLTGRIHKEAHCDMCGQFGHEGKDCKHNNINRKFPVRRLSYKHPYRKGYHSHWKSPRK